MGFRTPPRRRVVTAAILAAGYALNLWMTNVLREQAGGVDTIWSANAFVIGALLLLPARWAPACLGFGFVVQALIILAFDHPMFDAVGFSLLNVVEAMAVVALARRLNVVRLTTPGRFAGLIFFAMTPILIIGAGLLGLVILAMSGEFPVAMLLNRLAAKFLGMSLVLPAILLLGQGAVARARSPGKVWEAFGGYLLTAVVLALCFTPISVVALLAMFPVVTLLAARRGPHAVTLAIAVISIVLLSVGLGRTPAFILAGDGQLSRQISLTQVYLAMLFATGTITALMATHQQRLRALVLRRSANDRRSRDRAQAASVAKTDFLATMSHEIRTPLNAILGFTQLLDRRDDVNGEVRRQIGLVRHAGAALLTVVNDILDFSKVEAGRIELDPKPVDLAGACRDAMAIVADGAAEKGLSLDLVVTGEVGPAHLCDDHRLCQVLLNYLNNAVKFTDAGGVTLKLAVTPGEGRDHVRIAVRDTGVGIDPDAAARLFERFSQVDSSVSRSHGGTGLGLAISKGLVEAMGGRVGFESAPGAGSIFWLELDLERAAAALPVIAAAEEGDQAPGAHVLLVDDHPMNRELGVAILTLLGCSVDVACDGREAIEAAKRRRYDAILMDVHMPVLDGLAATRAIRALDAPSARSPIIAMSADVLPEQVARMHAAGMVDSVGKPVNIASLQDALNRWVGRDADGTEVSAA